MMKLNKLSMILLATAALAAAACQESIEYKDVVFFTGTESTAVTSMYIEGPSSIGLTVTSSKKLGEDMTVGVQIAPEVLPAFNQASGTSYQMLPEGSYKMEETFFTIENGKSVSLPVDFESLSIVDFDRERKECVSLCRSRRSPYD